MGKVFYAVQLNDLRTTVLALMIWDCVRLSYFIFYFYCHCLTLTVHSSLTGWNVQCHWDLVWSKLTSDVLSTLLVYWYKNATSVSDAYYAPVCLKSKTWRQHGCVTFYEKCKSFELLAPKVSFTCLRPQRPSPWAGQRLCASARM